MRGKIIWAGMLMVFVSGCTTITKGAKIAGDNLCENEDAITVVLISKGKIAEANAVTAFCAAKKNNVN